MAKQGDSMKRDNDEQLELARADVNEIFEGVGLWFACRIEVIFSALCIAVSFMIPGFRNDILAMVP